MHILTSPFNLGRDTAIVIQHDTYRRGLKQIFYVEVKWTDLTAKVTQTEVQTTLVSRPRGCGMKPEDMRSRLYA